MNLTVYTRDTENCSHKKDKYWRRCHCPKWLAVSDNRGFTRPSANPRSWDKAEQKAQEMVQPKQSSEPEATGRTSVQSAVENFSRTSRPKVSGVAITTSGPGDPQAAPWMDQDKSLVYFDKITLEHLEKFRANLPGGP